MANYEVPITALVSGAIADDGASVLLTAEADGGDTITLRLPSEEAYSLGFGAIRAAMEAASCSGKWLRAVVESFALSMPDEDSASVGVSIVGGYQLTLGVPLPLLEALALQIAATLHSSEFSAPSGTRVQ